MYRAPSESDVLTESDILKFTRENAQVVATRRHDLDDPIAARIDEHYFLVAC